MVKIKSFPNNQQLANSFSCGPVCLLNIYDFLEKNLDLDQILTDLNVNTSESTYLPQLARHLNNNQIITSILSSNTFVLTPEWIGKTNTEISGLLRQWLVKNFQSGWFKSALFLLFYLQEGGNIKIADLTTKLLDEYINRNNLLLVSVEESWLWGKKKKPGLVEYDSITGHEAGHFIIVYGSKNNEYLISDSYPTAINGRSGLYSIPKDKLLVSILLWNPEVLVIKK